MKFVEDGLESVLVSGLVENVDEETEGIEASEMEEVLSCVVRGSDEALVSSGTLSSPMTKRGSPL